MTSHEIRRHRIGYAASALAAALLLSACGSPQDEVFPSDPLTLVVNWPAGGGMDRAGRLVAEYARRRLEGGFENIGPTFEAMAAGHERDPARPAIEFYRRHDDVILFLPVRA